MRKTRLYFCKQVLFAAVRDKTFKEKLSVCKDKNTAFNNRFKGIFTLDYSPQCRYNCCNDRFENRRIAEERGPTMAENEKDLQPDYSPDIITLLDEDDKEHVFEVLDAADYNDERYMALVPYAETEEDVLEENCNLVIMKVCQDGDEEYLDVVEDDEEFYNISNIFAKRLEEFYDVEE